MPSFIEIHALQHLPANNINRSDDGSPKEMTMGGTRRARVSSQSWKKAIRRQMREAIKDNGTRQTKHQPRLVGQAVAEALPNLTESELVTGVNEFFAAVSHKDKGIAGIRIKEQAKTGKKDAPAEPEYVTGQAALATSDEELNALIEHAVQYLSLSPELSKDEAEKAKKDIKASLDKALETAATAYENALFGRMAASDTSYNVDAAVQFAHAVGTHALVPEVDFYTMFDDVEGDHSGATMIGDLEFNSSLLYRYANVDAEALVRTLKNAGTDEVAHVVAGFVRAFLTSMPSGKQSTFAAPTAPGVVILTVGGTQPFQLATAAFAKAVTGTDLMGESSRKLVRALTNARTKYNLNHDATFYFELDAEDSAVPSSVGTEVEDLNALIASVRTTVEGRLTR